jgi:hypothetical protein
MERNDVNRIQNNMLNSPLVLFKKNQDKMMKDASSYIYLVVVGQRRAPCLWTLPTRRETRGTQRHLASMPTSETSKCCRDDRVDE